MTNASQIREHMKVIGTDGQHVRTVDGAEQVRQQWQVSGGVAQGQAGGGISGT